MLSYIKTSKQFRAKKKGSLKPHIQSLLAQMNYFLLLAFMLAVGCNAQIKIYAPLSANDYFPQSQNSIINFTIANFGDIPYGKSIIGPVVKAIPEDGCSEIRNIKYEDQFQDNKQDKPIVLLKRGNCNFVLKVKNAQNAGAKLVIIVT